LKRSDFFRQETKNVTILSLAVLVSSACEPAMNHEGRLHADSMLQNSVPSVSSVDDTVDRSWSPKSTRLVRNKLTLKHGQNRFNIYCTPCHGDDGAGNGMIVQHGFLNPPSFHSEEVRRKSDDFYFGVISNGYGAMFSYADRLSVNDRWAVIDYIRALQLSQNIRWSDLTEKERRHLTEAKTGGKR